MQVDRSADVARLSGSVRGLGVCDVLRLELQPVQRAGLEQGLASRVAALELRQAELGAAVREDTTAECARAQLADVSEELRLLAQMRARLPEHTRHTVIFSGPAGLMLELVDICLTGAVAQLASRLSEAIGGPPRCSGVVAELEAAAAWIRTALDSVAVNAYCFEPGMDPSGPW